LGIAATTVAVHAHRGLRAVREALDRELSQDHMQLRQERAYMVMDRLWPAVWTWCPCWRSLPKKRSAADQRRSLYEQMEKDWNEVAAVLSLRENVTSDSAEFRSQLMQMAFLRSSREIMFPAGPPAAD
jgi:hypothetical protein